ncbi:MAG: zinc-ribbon domain-containing protein [Alphaproteobacteria bacterium]|nr:zinc-ribbon domain-containing protein [Alphaproteobacteria bacterium]
MIITCPSCGTRYKSEAARFEPSGRNVRCAKCGHRWYQDPQAAKFEPKPVDPTAEAPAGPVAPAMTAPKLPETPAARSFGAKGSAASAAAYDLSRAEAVAAETSGRSPGWRKTFAAGAGIALLGLAALALLFRVDIVRAFPPSASLFGLLNLPIKAGNLWFEDSAFEWRHQDGKTILVVKGEIVNLTDETQPVPPVRVVLRDAQEAELYHWVFVLDDARLSPHGRTKFEQWLASPPVEARDVVLTFVSGQG